MRIHLDESINYILTVISAQHTPRKGQPYTQQPNLQVPQQQGGVATHVEPTHVPGLDLNTPRTMVPVGDVYIENRLLTPSQFRQHQVDPNSPRREFGTQTGRCCKRLWLY